MNLTLAVDETTVARARKNVESMGKSLNQAIREYLHELAGQGNTEADIAELERLSKASKGRSSGWKFNRDEIHERS